MDSSKKIKLVITKEVKEVLKENNSMKADIKKAKKSLQNFMMICRELGFVMEGYAGWDNRDDIINEILNTPEVQLNTTEEGKKQLFSIINGVFMSGAEGIYR